MRYTADDLITAIKRNGSLPSSQNKFSDADFLAFLNEELQLTIVGELVDFGQDYFVTTADVSLVANQSEYDMPSTSVGWKVDAVGYVDSAGGYNSMSKINRSQRGLYGGIADSSSPAAFYIEGNKIIVVPSIGTAVSGALRFDFVRLQNELVKTTSCGIVTTVAVVGANYQITLGSLPSSTYGVDIISGTNPFDIIARQQTVVPAGFVITIPVASFERAPVAGDYAAPFGKSPVPNIPEDFHPVLAQAATIRCLASLNDIKGLQGAGATLGLMLDKLRKRSRRRVNSAPNKIVPRNRILNMMRR